jgi:predicted secreted protein
MRVRLGPTDADEQSVEIRPHEQLIIALDQPGGTGYAWQLGAVGADSRVTDEWVEADTTADTFGGTAEQVFVVEVLTEGTTELTFTLAAPWADQPAREQRLIIHSEGSAETGDHELPSDGIHP